MTIPDGYVLVPKETADLLNVLAKKYFAIHGWNSVVEPTISEISEYLNFSVDKIKKDLRNIDCPLRVTNKSKGGRGHQLKFSKASVESYKQWLQQKQ